MEFAFAPEVTDINTVPEDFRGFYAQNGDKFLIKDDPIIKSSVKAIGGLTGSLKAARAEAKAYKSKAVDLAPLAEYGDSPEKILEAINKKLEDAATGGDVKLKANLENAKKALLDAHGKELGARDKRITGLQEQLYKHLVDNNATTVITELKGVPELLLPFIRNQVKVVEADGAFNVQVVDEQGNIRYGTTGAPMTIKELVAGMKGDQKFARLFESEAPQGGGRPPNQRPSNAAVNQNRQEGMSSIQKIQAGLNKGQASRPGRS